MTSSLTLTQTIPPTIFRTTTDHTGIVFTATRITWEVLTGADPCGPFGRVTVHGEGHQVSEWAEIDTYGCITWPDRWPPPPLWFTDAAEQHTTPTATASDVEAA